MSFVVPTRVEKAAPLLYYLDESGTHAEAPYCVIAGYLSNEVGWKRFEEDWQNCLALFGIPSFHMSEFESRLGAFQGWTNAQRLRLIMRLAEIINRWTAGGAVAAINLRNYYSEFVPSLSADSRELSDPYLICLLCFMGDLGHAASQMEPGEMEPVAFVLERNTKSAGKAVKFFEAVKTHTRSEQVFGKIRYAGKDACVQLQAADILAYETYKDLKNRADGSGRPQRKLLTKLRENDRILGSVMKTEQLMALLKEVRNDSR